MNNDHKFSQFLVCCWRLGNESSKIPTSHGLLDRALKQLVDKGQLPQWVIKYLHFVDSRIGLQCVELPSVLEWAQRSQLTTAPNPSYESTDVQISKRVAIQLLASLGVSVDDAQRWGNALREQVDVALKSSSALENLRIEEY